MSAAAAGITYTFGIRDGVTSQARGRFSSMHVRALCHATEVRARVEQAVLNVAGEAELESSKTHGHHGNEIIVIEAHMKGSRQMERLLCRLSAADVREIRDTVDERMDDSCNLFIRLDKQKAFSGELTLADNDDAVAVRAKVAAYPARKSVATQAVRDFLDSVIGQG